ncbi:MAG: DUF1552 domain-containing protein [Phycisphaera sp.]|nr:DUF1552 domain-containing protein [Phycisphaera sp.]
MRSEPRTVSVFGVRAPRLSRRLFLRGVGVGMALPALDAMIGPRAIAAGAAGAHDAATPQRMVAVCIPLGFYGPAFFPEKPGRDYEPSDYLKLAAKLRDDFTVCSGVSHPEVDGGHSAEKSYLTCAPHPGARNFKNSISLDQFVAKRIGHHTRFASMTLGDLSLSWSANGVSIPTEHSPTNTYTKLFTRGSDKEIAALKQGLRDGRSVMDTVLEDAKDMQAKVSTADRDKLDQYFTAVRQTEQELVKAEKWSDTPKPEVEAKAPGKIDAADVTGRLAAFYGVMRLALQTDSTRVITLGGNGGGLVPPLKGVDQGYHGLSHHGKNPAMIQQLEIVERATMQAWVDFVADLKATPEGDGTLLDRTQVLLGSNLGNASGHITTNLPIALAGGAYRHGQHLAFDTKHNYPLANLFVSMLQRLGLEEDHFGSSTGTMRGLDFKKA